MNPEVVNAAAEVLNCSYDEAEKFLNDGTGAYIYVGGEQHWLSGQLVYDIAEAAVRNTSTVY